MGASLRSTNNATDDMCAKLVFGDDISLQFEPETPAIKFDREHCFRRQAFVNKENRVQQSVS